MGSGFPAQYLMDASNVVGTGIMTKLRIGHALVMERVARLLGLPAQAGLCLLCRLAPESIQHFIQVCPRLNPFREGLLREVAARLACCGRPGRVLLQEFMKGGMAQLDLLLGKSFAFPNWCTGDEEERVACGKALFSFDKTVENYLVMCWKYRQLLIGQISVRHGRLEANPAKDRCFEQALEKLGRQSQVGGGSLRHQEQFWADWVPRCRQEHSRNGNKKKAVVYRVYKGRKEGVFYRWCDVVASVANFPGASFRGFETFEEVYRSMSSIGEQSLSA